MNDEQMQSVLDEWFEDTDPQPPDARRTAANVLAHVPQTRQRGRWLPFWLSRPKAQPTTATETTEYQPSPVPANNGHTPTVIGRTQSMLSPVKAITAGALVFAIGGTFLIAQPFSQRSGVPGAAIDEFVAPVEVTGAMSGGPGAGCQSTDKEGPFEDSGANAGLFTCSTETGLAWSFSDPRLEGIVTRINEEVTFAVGEVSDVYLNSTAFSIENDGGAWRERPRTWLLPDGALTFDWLPEEVLVLHGSGDYEGLVAVLRTTGGLSDFRGFIIDARWMPPPPENVLTD